MFPRYSLKCFCSHRTKLLMLREAKRVDSPDGNKQNKPPPGVWVHFSRPLSSTMRFFSLFALALVACAALASTTTDVDDMDLSMDIFDGPAPAELGAAPSIYRLKGVVNWLVSAFLKTRSTLYKMRSNFNITRTSLRRTRERLATEKSRAIAAENALRGLLNAQATTTAAQSTQMRAEMQRAFAAEASLRALVSLETARAQTAEADLHAVVWVEKSRAAAADEGLTMLVESAEQTLAAQVAATRSLATAATGSQAEDFAAEVARGLAAEASINARVAAAVQRATEIEGELESALALEASRAAHAEQAAASQLATATNTLSSQILAARAIASSDLADEVHRAIVAEASLNANIVAEEARATGAESELAAANALERSRAITSEEMIVTQVSIAANTATVNVAVTAALQQEQSRALAAEAVLAAGQATLATSLAQTDATLLNVTDRMNGNLPCPANSVGQSIGKGCVCNAGFRPVMTPSLTAPFTVLVCEAVACPSMTVGSTVVQGCTCNTTAGYYGPALVATTTAPYYNNSPCRRFSSCVELQAQTTIPAPFGKVSGVYNILYGANTILPVFCDQVTSGGGWELALKIGTASGTQFAFSSSLWSSTTSLNAGSLDETDSSAIFPQYYTGNYSQVLAKLRHGIRNFTWPVTRINPAVLTTTYNSISGFFNYPGGYSFMTGPNGYGLNTNVNGYAGLPYWTSTYLAGTGSSNLFSYERGAGGSHGGGYHDFALNGCCGIQCVRWGYLQNNENDCNTNDVESGIGVTTSSYNNLAPRHVSAGDNALFAEVTDLGVNAPIFASFWGRRV
eukprot:m.174484 g.174484  ORF g.174484 m.174484 type:complete len:803 (-) comp15322_c1_seq2:224-2632(-)